MAVKSAKNPKLDEVMGRVALVTQSLLEDGAQPSQVVFALTSVAADMGLQVAGNPLQVFSVLLDAIAGVAKARLQIENKNQVLELTDEKPGDGTTIH
jgi:hypothetical protein